MLVGDLLTNLFGYYLRLHDGWKLHGMVKLWPMFSAQKWKNNIENFCARTSNGFLDLFMFLDKFQLFSGINIPPVRT